MDANCTSEGAKDRRSNTRNVAEAYASLYGDTLTRDADQSFGVIVNMSEGGLRYRTPQPPFLLDFVTLRVGVGEEIREIPAKVAHITPTQEGVYHVGLSILLRGEQRADLIQALQQAYSSAAISEGSGASSTRTSPATG